MFSVFFITMHSHAWSMWGKIIIPMYGYYTAYMEYMDPNDLCPQKGR